MEHFLEFDKLQNHLTDVRIYIDHKSIDVHRTVLAAGSDFFKSLLEENILIDDICIYLPEFKLRDIEMIIKFLYKGEVLVKEQEINSVIETALSLNIKGLSEFSSMLWNNMSVVEQDGGTISDTRSKSESSLLQENMTAKQFEQAETYQYLDEEITNVQCLEYPIDNQLIECNITIRDEIQVMEPGCELEDLNVVSTETATPCTKLLRQNKRLGCKGNFHSYSEDDLEAALNDLKSGCKLSATAIAHGIPKSTLYLHGKARGAVAKLVRAEHSDEDVNEAIQAVFDGLSLKQAGNKYKIPKTVLWRKLRKNYKGEDVKELLGKRLHHQDPGVMKKAALELVSGSGISQVAEKYNIPLATVFRKKKSLVAEGRLDPSTIRQKSKSKLSGSPVYKTANTYDISKRSEISKP